MKPLSEHVLVSRRFSRSANVERDQNASAIDGYIPTGRALDVLSRIARGLTDSTAGRAFSVTGPPGGGKSSLAVFLSALVSARDSQARQTAIDLLSHLDPHGAEEWVSGLAAVGGEQSGFVKAFVTADRESVAATIARGIHAGANRELGQDQTVVPAEFASASAANPPTSREVLTALQALAGVRPVMIVVDEFGKNLEAYAESGAEGDPYLLQQIAELGQGATALPVVILTLQHLSFDEYVQDATLARRRDWAKVQGRFQDVPYVETSAQSRRLIASTVSIANNQLKKDVVSWVDSHIEILAQVGLREIAEDAKATYPLHPVSLAVLPELCTRYGQNERTLFSFLAGPEPLAVPQFLAEHEWRKGGALPLVSLDRVYDYFLSSAGTSIGASSTASRWLEIEHRLRDAIGLSDLESRVLKAVGVLNLVASSGTLRASAQMLRLCLTDGLGKSSAIELQATISALESRGLITYREFSDEYRIWQGSDYDLRASVDVARHAASSHTTAWLLNQVVESEPSIAGRHSQSYGFLRVFQRTFSDLRSPITPPDVNDAWDGILVLATEPVVEAISIGLDAKPVVIASPHEPLTIHEYALEAYALQHALRQAADSSADWVARRELQERLALAVQALREQVAKAWSPQRVDWLLLNTGEHLNGAGGASAVLSRACDVVFSGTPRLANEMLARRELTSQGAKARRLVVEAMLIAPAAEGFGITGHGPERAIYEALFLTTGLHRADLDGWAFHVPTDSRWSQVWQLVMSSLDDAVAGRLPIVQVYEALKAAPFGLKDGMLPLLLCAALVHRGSEIALYEHGSLVLTLDDAVAERLVKNPAHFSVRNSDVNAGPRKVATEALASRLGLEATATMPTFLQVTRACFRELRTLAPFVLNTRVALGAEAMAVRDAFRNAVEPDELLFSALPGIYGMPPIHSTGKLSAQAAQRYADAIANSLLELRHAFPQLCDEVRRMVSTATAIPGTDLEELRRRLTGQALNLQDRVLEPKMKAFITALCRDSFTHEDWLQNVAMVIADGHPMRSWTDEDVHRFEVQVTELGGAFRRLQALLYTNVAGQGEGFESRRVTITASDGSETSEVLSISPSDRNAIEAIAGPALKQLENAYGGQEAARRLILAWLVLDATKPKQLGTGIKSTKGA